MNIESDSEFQAYMSQLYKKSQEFKFEETSSDDISPPSHLESISINTSERNTKNKLKKLSKEYINKSKTLEKSLKRSDQENSTNASFLEHPIHLDAFGNDSEPVCIKRPNSKSDKIRTASSKVSTARTDEILNLNNVMSFDDLINDNKPIDDPTIGSELEALTNVCPNSFISEEKDLDISDRQLSSLDKEENKNIFYATNKPELQRQSSTSSLLLHREGVFYADKTKRKNSILFYKDEVVWVRESNEGSNNVTTDSKTSQTESIEEDLPAREVKMRSKKESKESLLSTVSETRKKIVPEKIGELVVEDKNKETITRASTIEDLKTTNVATKYETSKFNKKTKHRGRKHSLGKNIKISESSLSHSLTEMSNENSPHRSSKIKARSVRSFKNKSPQMNSSTCSSSSESTHISNFSIKIKPKKSKKLHRKKHQRRLKDKDLLVELIIKTMVKALPKLQQNLYQENPSYSHPMAPTFVSPKFPTSHKSAGSTANNGAPMHAGLTIPLYQTTVSTDRIDNALREYVALTRQFLDTHQTMYEAYLNILTKDSKNSLMQKVEEILNKRSPFVSLNDTYRVMNELKNKSKKEGVSEIRGSL